MFKKTGKRVSVPGADDNGTAVATLLRAAERFSSKNGAVPPKHDIWLVHLTGEEYPADDLGARYLMRELRRKKQDLSGFVLLDMAGFNKKGETSFQINPGDRRRRCSSPHSRCAPSRRRTDAAICPDAKRFESYLYNTDTLF